MSKRGASSLATNRPANLPKEENVWSLIPEEDDKEFIPIEDGPETRITKSAVPYLNPGIVVATGLTGFQPEVRFTGPDNTFTMSGEEFLDMAGASALARPLDRVRLEAVEDGFRLARYAQTEPGVYDVFPTAVFNMYNSAARLLKNKLELICDRVCAIRDSEDVIKLMFQCIADVYKREFLLLNSQKPIHDHYLELSRIVEVYVQHENIVSVFLDRLHKNRLLSKFNHYNLCAVAMAQKTYLLELIV